MHPLHALSLAVIFACHHAAMAQQQPARISCGAASPDQSICDALAPSSSQRGMRVPVNSQCVQDSSTKKYFCGYAGAQCISDAQCDFGRCSGRISKPGKCLGGLGDSCEGPDGPDDSLCLGNLACSTKRDGTTAVCGGTGAECLYTGNYSPGDVPNHAACLSGLCDKKSLTCVDRPRPVKAPWNSNTRLREAAERAATAAVAEERRLRDKQRAREDLSAAQRQRRPQISFNTASDSSTDGDDALWSEDPEWLADSFGEDADADMWMASDFETDDETEGTEAEYQEFLRHFHAAPARETAPQKAANSRTAEKSMCPAGFSFCQMPTSSLGGSRMGSFDTSTSVNQCGGCVIPAHGGMINNEPVGVDCLAQEGVVSAACIQGRCRTYSCRSDYDFDRVTGKCRPRRFGDVPR